MRDLKTIVMGTDFSHSANKALAHAIGFAKMFGARLVIVVVYDLVHLMIEMAPEMGPVPDEFPSNFPTREKLKKAMDELADRARAEGVSTETRIEDGRAYVSLIRVARERQAGMLVMGTRGLTGLDHILVGSTAEQVVRMAPCPVLTVRAAADEPGTPEFGNIRHIVVPVDFSIFSQEAVECVIPIAERFNSEIYLFHVHEQHLYALNPPGTPTQSGAGEHTREQISDQMAKLLRMFLERGLQATSRMGEGRTDEQIVKTAENVHADLIVMGTHGRTGLQHTLIGSIAEKVVRRSPCPVVTIKSPSFKFTAP